MATNDRLRYPFERLDEIIGTALVPGSSTSKQISLKDLPGLQQQIRSETGKIWKNLSAQTFLLLSHKKIAAMLRQYQESLDELKWQAIVNMAAYPEDNPLNSFFNQVLAELEQLDQQFRRRYRHYFNDETDTHKSAGSGPAAGDHQPLFKITCRLSVDQVAILLKAADETRLLSARSFSLVLRSITPFLSTERMPNFSWKSARNSTLKIEERDKAIAIGTLEELIRKIKTY